MHWNEEELREQMIGQKVKEIEKSDDDMTIRIICDSEWQFVGETGRDCHVTTYFYSIEGEDSLLGNTITDIEFTHSIDVGESYDYENAYTYQRILITTLKGRTQIEMRCENEDYYGIAFDVYRAKQYQSHEMQSTYKPWRSK